MQSWKMLQILSCRQRRGFRKKGIEVLVNFYKETKEVIAEKIWLDRQLGGHCKKKIKNKQTKKPHKTGMLVQWQC